MPNAIIAFLLFRFNEFLSILYISSVGIDGKQAKGRNMEWIRFPAEAF